MIDFTNGSFIKLKQVKDGTLVKEIQPLLIDGEDIIGEYKAIRDYCIFTTKRIITVNVQGVTGKKKDYSSLPYSKISAFSVETSGVFDLDSELEMYFSGLGKVKYEFSGGCDIVRIGKIIADYVL